jgi:diguanylate cyclase
LDLDGFKRVNDTKGHHVGDELLKRVSNILLTRIRISDTVARTGGDEFSMILEGPVTRVQAEAVRKTLKTLLSEPMNLDGHHAQISASTGLAMFPEDATSAEPLCIAADSAMYAEKGALRERARWSGTGLAGFPQQLGTALKG